MENLARRLVAILIGFTYLLSFHRTVALAQSEGLRARVDGQGEIMFLGGEAPLRLTGVKVQPKGILSVTISRDGSRIAAGGEGGVLMIWDAEDCHALHVIDQGHEALINAVAFSQSGKWLASGGPARLVLVQNPSGSGSRRSQFNGSFVNVYEESSGRKLTSINPGNVADLLKFTKSDVLMAASAGIAFLSAWEAGSDRPSRLDEISRSNLTGYVNIQLPQISAISDDTGRAASCQSGEIRLRYADRPGTRTIAYGSRETPAAIALGADGKQVGVIAHDHSLTIWDFESGALERTFPSAVSPSVENRPVFLAFGPEGKTVISGGKDGVVRMWKWASDRPTRTIAGPASPVRAMAFRNDSIRVVSGGWARESPGDAVSGLTVWDIAVLHHP